MALLRPLAAPAAQTTIGVQPNVVNWQHDEADYSSNSGLLGVIGELKVRQSRFEFFAEGIPGISGSGPSGAQYAVGTPTISALHLDARYYFFRGLFAGVGEAIYNQSTPTYFPGFTERSSSRVVGGRYSLGAHLPLGGPLFAEAMVAWMPAMQGLVTYIPTPGYFRSGYGEHATNVETVLAVGRRSGRAEYLVGFRNINYNADFNDGTIADRNVITGGFLEFRYVFGR